MVLLLGSAAASAAGIPWTGRRPAGRVRVGRAPLSEEWSASLELVMVLLETVLPKDFKRFK